MAASDDHFQVMRHLRGDPPAGFRLPTPANLPTGFRARLGELFQGDHITAGLICAYLFVTRLMQAAFSAPDSTTQPPNTRNTSTTHFLTNCAGPEVAMDTVALFAFTFLYFIRHFSTGHGLRIALLHTLHLFVGLALAHNQPLSCALTPETHKTFRIVAGVVLGFTVLLLIRAHWPNVQQPRYEASESGRGLQRGITASMVLNHSDQLLAVLYDVITKATESADPITCSVSCELIGEVALALIAVLFFAKHFVRLYHPDTQQPPDHEKAHILLLKLRNLHVGVRVVGGWHLLSAFMRSVGFCLYQLSSNSHPLACGLTRAQLQTLTYAQCSMAAFMAFVALATHPFYQARGGRIAPDPEAERPSPAAASSGPATRPSASNTQFWVNPAPPASQQSARSVRDLHGAAGSYSNLPLGAL